MTISDARTSVTQSLTGLTIDMYNKLDTGSSNDRIGAAISTYGDTNAYTIRDSVGIRAMSRQSTGAEVTRLNTPLHAVLDLANTAIANNSGTTLSGRISCRCILTTMILLPQELVNLQHLFHLEKCMLVELKVLKPNICSTSFQMEKQEMQYMVQQLM